MLEDIKKMIQEDPDITCYRVALKLGLDPCNLSVAKNYWRAKYELLSANLPVSDEREDDDIETDLEENFVSPKTNFSSRHNLPVRGGFNRFF